MQSFDRHGPALPASPVILSVPHAGRDYPPALRAALRVPLSAAVALEDRHVDAVAMAARRDETLFVQRTARAWIDLNRGEYERDPRVDDGARPQAMTQASDKLRGGLGLVPRRTARAGDLWRRRFSGDEIAARIAADHRPYHAALAAALAAARARFGVAILLDVHSMPSIGETRIVIGDRFGQSAAPRFVARLEASVAQRSAMNVPYAGGHVLTTHGRPAEGIHAIQLEIDRALYLDAALDRPGAGMAATVTLLRRIIDALTDEARADAGDMVIAAE